MNNPIQVSESKRRLEEILTKDEYTFYLQAEDKSFWDFLKPIGRWLRSLLPDIHVSEGTGAAMAYGLMVLALLVVIYAIYWFSKQLIRQGRVRRQAAYLPEDATIRSYDYYWSEALRLGNSRMWREGVRCGFLALLFYLEDQERIRVEKWKTNWEYASELNDSAPSLAPVFEESSLLFERIWYGNEAVTEADYTTMVGRVAHVVEKEVTNRNGKME
jgi:hypothetical protein